MSRSTNSAAPALQVALLGNPGICDRLRALLELAIPSAGLVAQVIVGTTSPEGLTLLMGLDDAQADEVSPDRLLREDLAIRGVAFQVLYGSEQERLAQTLQMIKSQLTDKTSGEKPERPQPANIPPHKTRPWVWSCDKCSDPQCEHLLLSSLLASRESAPTEPLT